MMMTKTMITKKTDNQLLIEKFCEEKINWPREMKNVGQLLKIEPLVFWQFLVLGFKLKSLSWFFGIDGKKEITKNKKIFAALQIKKSAEVKNNNIYIRQTETKKSFRDRLTN